MRMFSFKYSDGTQGVIFTDYAYNWFEMQKEHSVLEKAECIAEITTDMRESDIVVNQVLLAVKPEEANILKLHYDSV